MNRFLASLRGRLFRASCRLFGRRVEIGDGLRLHGRLEIRGKGTVILGRDCSIHPVPGNKSRYVTLHTNSPDAVIRIGDGVALCATRFSCKYAITIGDRCLIEDASILDTDFHSIDASRENPAYEDPDRCRISIGNDVSIASGSTVAKGVVLGAKVVVGPASMVTRSIPDGCVVLGNPARPLKANGDA
jgi:acetyltransferase-like isoleucine patch superfamily enzyme